MKPPSKTAQFTQTEVLLPSLPMARACTPSALPSACRLVSDENRLSKSISDAPSEPRNQAVFVQISFPRCARLPAIKQWSHSTLKGVFLRGQVSGRKRAKRKSLISCGWLAGLWMMGGWMWNGENGKMGNKMLFDHNFRQDWVQFRMDVSSRTLHCWFVCY